MGACVRISIAAGALPEPDRQEFQPPRLTRKDLLSDVMRRSGRPRGTVRLCSFGSGIV